MRIEVAEGGAKLERQLTLFDSVMIVVSGTIGASIFIVPADVLRAVPNPAIALLLWVVVGGITMIAGLACAELGAMYPEAGGQYVFIREAYGRFAAFLYGWVLFTAGNSGALAAMAISSAIFIGRAFPQFAPEHVVFALRFSGLHVDITRETVFAVGAVIVPTAVNLRSVRVAAWLQNVTAMGYLTALALIVVVGLSFGHGSWSHFHAPAKSVMEPVTLGGLGVGMIALFFCYDGWEFLSWVGGEIKNPGRNLPLGLILGISLIIITYLLANVVFLYALPPQLMAQQPALADAAMTALFSHNAGQWVSLFIGVISFGAASVVVLGGRAHLLQHGARRQFLREHEQDSSALEDAEHRAARTMRLGHRAHRQRPLRAAIYLLYLHDDRDLRAHGRRRLHPAADSAGPAEALPLHRLSVVARALHRGLHCVRHLYVAQPAGRIDHRSGDGRPRRSFVLVSTENASCGRFLIYNYCQGDV